MQKIKKGYTLAEVLITLSIIGTIAALTVPSLYSGVGKSYIGPSLYKTVELIENGMRNVMQAATDRAESNQAANNQTEVSLVATTLADLTFRDILGGNDATNIITSANLFETLRGYIGADIVSANDGAYLRNARNYSGNGLISATYNFINGTAYKFPNSKAIFVYETANNNNINTYVTRHNNYLSDDVVIARIIIDANGQETPNRFGQDIFLFGLTNNGQLVPAGSEAYNKNVFNGGMGASVNLYTTDCTNNNITTGASCAARVSADKWKVEYK